MNDQEGVGHGPQVIARVGGEERAITSGETTAELNELARASFRVDASEGPVDLTAEVQLLACAPPAAPGGELLPIFTGHAVKARASAGSLQVEAGSGQAMVEGQVGILHVAGEVALDTVYMLCKQAGQEVEFQGFDAAVREVFAVEMPLVGAKVSTPMRGTGVEVLPLSRLGEEEFGPFKTAIDQITERWGRPSARARTYVVGTRMYDVELSATRKIESFINALSATAGYGFSQDPWGRDLPFDRGRTRARLSLLPVVFTQGLTTGRRWLHDPGGSDSTELDISSSFSNWAEILSDVPEPDVALGLSALRDAADEARSVPERCHALCTVLEYYATASRPPPVVSKGVKKQVLRSLASIDMTAAEKKRLREYLGQVNSPPLLARVRHQVTQDNTPLSEVEWDLLSKIRKNRNDTVHGRVQVGAEVSAEDLRWGVSIASRLLLYRWVRGKAE